MIRLFSTVHTSWLQTAILRTRSINIWKYSCWLFLKIIVRYYLKSILFSLFCDLVKNIVSYLFLNKQPVCYVFISASSNSLKKAYSHYPLTGIFLITYKVSSIKFYPTITLTAHPQHRFLVYDFGCLSKCCKSFQIFKASPLLSFTMQNIVAILQILYINHINQ